MLHFVHIKILKCIKGFVTEIAFVDIVVCNLKCGANAFPKRRGRKCRCKKGYRGNPKTGCTGLSNHRSMFTQTKMYTCVFIFISYCISNECRINYGDCKRGFLSEAGMGLIIFKSNQLNYNYFGF